MVKGCNCSERLVVLPKELHPNGEPLRCPYTGRFISVREYERNYM